MFFIKLLMILLTLAGYIFVLFTHYEEASFPNRGNIIMGLLYAFIFFILASVYGCFRIGILRIRELIISYALSATFTNFICYIVLCLIAQRILPVLPMAVLTAAHYLFALLWYMFANKVYFNLYPVRDCLAICRNDKQELSVIEKFARQRRRYNIQKVCFDTEGFDALTVQIDFHSTIIIGNIANDLRAKLTSYCFENNKRLFIIPTVQDVMLRNAHETQIEDSLVYLCKNRSFSFEQLIIKRVMDVFISLVAIIITSPIMLIAALLIKWYDGGPVFFKQERYTRDAQKFIMIKFRSMVINAEQYGAQFTTKKDKRITPIGRVIRSTRIDELPQLFNVLKGDMSLVGPRAERIENVEAYSKLMPEFRYRLKVKAGLTGYAQIYGKYNTSYEDKVKMDLVYIENCSLMMDLRLLVSTLKVLFIGESTEGFQNATLTELMKAAEQEDLVSEVDTPD